jgi:ribosomal protein S1
MPMTQPSPCRTGLDSSTDFKTLRRGEVIEGSIMAIQRDGVIVDLGSKSEGVIPPHEMHSWC